MRGETCNAYLLHIPGTGCRCVRCSMFNVDRSILGANGTQDVPKWRHGGVMMAMLWAKGAKGARCSFCSHYQIIATIVALEHVLVCLGVSHSILICMYCTSIVHRLYHDPMDSCACHFHFICLFLYFSISLCFMMYAMLSAIRRSFLTFFLAIHCHPLLIVALCRGAAPPKRQTRCVETDRDR